MVETNRPEFLSVTGPLDGAVVSDQEHSRATVERAKLGQVPTLVVIVAQVKPKVEVVKTDDGSIILSGAGLCKVLKCGGDDGLLVLAAAIVGVMEALDDSVPGYSRVRRRNVFEQPPERAAAKSFSGEARAGTGRKRPERQNEREAIESCDSPGAIFSDLGIDHPRGKP